jgi:polyphenol oxidase
MQSEGLDEAAFGVVPKWAAPANVGALMSTRNGGVSTGPYASLNLGAAVLDAPEHVSENRRRFAQATGATPVWMQQVHGLRVLHLAQAPVAAGQSAAVEQADAAVTATPGLACTVQTADCLAVLFAARNGGAVGAAHAGWRGLGGGVLEQTAAAVAALAGCDTDGLVAWLGPCIGPSHFEVGEDVLRAFEADANAPGPHFHFRARPDGSPAWLGNLQGLALGRLQALRLGKIDALAACTVRGRDQWFSYRREKVTGRMAAAVWLRA